MFVFSWVLRLGCMHCPLCNTDWEFLLSEGPMAFTMRSPWGVCGCLLFWVVLMGKLRAMASMRHVPNRLLWLNALFHYLGGWAWLDDLNWGFLVVYYAQLLSLTLFFFLVVVGHEVTDCLILLVTWTEPFVLPCLFTIMFETPFWTVSPQSFFLPQVGSLRDFATMKSKRVNILTWLLLCVGSHFTSTGIISRPVNDLGSTKATFIYNRAFSG